VADIAALNQLLWSMGVKFRAEMTRPAGPSPQRLPVNQSFTLAVTHNFFTFAGAIRRLLARTTPEAIAQRGRRLGSPVSPLAIWMLGYHFLVGRESLLDFDEVSSHARADHIDVVLDHWRRLAFAHRGDGHLDNSDAGAANTFLPATSVQQLYRALIPMDAGITRRVRQFFAALEGYLFILNAEAHLSVADSGPYPLNVERVLIVRDYFDLQGRQYPWREVAADLPYHTCSLAFTLDPVDFHSIELSDRSRLLTSPTEYAAAIREIALVSHDSGALRVLPFTEMDRLVRAVKKIQPKLLEWFDQRSPRERIVYGALPWVLRPSVLVDREEISLNEFAPEAARLLPSYEDDDAQAIRWATRRCFAPGRVSAFTPLV
jgi:hypothetical protein